MKKPIDFYFKKCIIIVSKRHKMEHWKNNDNTDEYRGYSIQSQSGVVVARNGWGKVVFAAENVLEIRNPKAD